MYMEFAKNDKQLDKKFNIFVESYSLKWIKISQNHDHFTCLSR